MRTAFTVIACFCFCCFVQFLSILGGTIWAIGGGVLSAAIFFALLKFFDVELRRAWLRYLLPIAASLVATALAFVGGSLSDPLQWWAAGGAAAVSACV